MPKLCRNPDQHQPKTKILPKIQNPDWFVSGRPAICFKATPAPTLVHSPAKLAQDRLLFMHIGSQHNCCIIGSVGQQSQLKLGAPCQLNPASKSDWLSRPGLPSQMASHQGQGQEPGAASRGESARQAAPT